MVLFYTLTNKSVFRENMLDTRFPSQQCGNHLNSLKIGVWGTGLSITVMSEGCQWLLCEKPGEYTSCEGLFGLV